MTPLLSAFVSRVLQGVVKSKNNFVYNPVSVSFNIKVFTAYSLIKAVPCHHLMVE